MQTLPKDRTELKSMLEYMRKQGATDDELRSAVQEVKQLRPNVNFSSVSQKTSAKSKEFNQKFIQPVVKSIKEGFQTGEQEGEAMQERRLGVESRPLGIGRTISRTLEEVGQPVLGALEGATAPIADLAIKAGKTVLSDKQEQSIGETAENLAQKYEDFKSNLSPEARVKFDEVATVLGLGGYIGGAGVAKKGVQTGLTKAKQGVVNAIESPEFQTGLDVGLEAGQQARGAVVGATKIPQKIKEISRDTIPKFKTKIESKLETDMTNDLQTFFKSKRSLEQTVKEYQKRKNIDLTKYLADQNLFKGIKAVENSIDPTEAIEILDGRIENFMKAKQDILPIIDEYKQPISRETLLKATMKEIDESLTPADAKSVGLEINKQINALPETITYQELDNFRKKFRKAAVDAKGIQKRDTEYAAIENAIRNEIFDASENLPFDTNKEYAKLNKEIKDAVNAKEFLDKTLRGQKLGNARLGNLFGKTVGAIAGSKLGIVGALAGSELGGAITKILTNNQFGGAFKYKLIKNITDDPKILQEVENLLKKSKQYEPLALPAPKDEFKRKIPSGPSIPLPESLEGRDITMVPTKR